VNIVLSAEDLVACDHTDYGCGGGYLNNAWEFIAKSGLVTDQCFPYTSGSGSVPTCPTSCTTAGASFVRYTCDANSIVEGTTVD